MNGLERQEQEIWHAELQRKKEALDEFPTPKEKAAYLIGYQHAIEFVVKSDTILEENFNLNSIHSTEEDYD